MSKLKLIFADYQNAIAELEGALSRKTDDDLVQAGCIKYFEFCFELAWKTVKEAALDQGYPDCLSPKACLRQAFAAGWIDNETIWLEMLEARNIMAHTYCAKDALKIYGQLLSFATEMRALQNAIAKLI